MRFWALALALKTPRHFVRGYTPGMTPWLRTSAVFARAEPLIACDEDCPHVEARTLWAEALATFGKRANDLAFLRSRATMRPEPPALSSRQSQSVAAELQP